MLKKFTYCMGYDSGNSYKVHVYCTKCHIKYWTQEKDTPHPPKRCKKCGNTPNGNHPVIGDDYEVVEK